jgi:DNA-binding beta-propeller fold protein YncE
MIHIVPCRVRQRLAVVVALLVCCVVATPARASNFTLFETGQVRPLAQSPDGTHVFAINTPDDRLEIFSVGGGTLTHVSSVPVGLEPIAVAARSNSEVWVVNHLSDSVSIVDVSVPTAPRVVRTLLVGDEPRDIVFAGPSGHRAFITTAHRGQNTSLQASIHTVLTTPGIGRADVWVFDANNLGVTLGGTPETIVTLFGDTPRALAVSPDGNTVYAAIFHSGNRTTAITEGAVCDGGAAAPPCGKVCAAGANMHVTCANNSECPGSTCVVESPGGLPAPNTDHNLLQQPEVALIVKFDGSHWFDELGRQWDNAVNFNLPDKDVFAIDATQSPPVETGVYTGVGTVLFNMVVNPVSGHVYVANTDAQNDVRFEGTGVFSAMFKPITEPASVRGHLAESRITVLDSSTVTPRHLNKHIDYGTCCAAPPNAEHDASLAFPLGMAVSSDGSTLYVAGFGSSKIGVYVTADLEDNSFTPGANDLTLTGLGACPGGSCGPTGLVLDETNTRLYVLTRFDNGISVVSTGTGMELAHLSLHNPEPASIVNGRRFNYDASFTSSHGDSACASCHIFSDFDSLAWDLGDPDGNLLSNPGPFQVGPFGSPPGIYTNFHPLKGPMTTQSLRGMANEGPMHWRGDRTGGNDAPSSQPDSGTFDEQAAFKKFNVAFPGLLGRNAQLTAAEMQAYTDFILQVTYPPNPIRALDNSLTANEQAGKNFFNGPPSDTLQDCNGCHRLAPGANEIFGIDKPGFFGTEGKSSFENETQHFKVPHLRNMYQKVGMFGMPDVPFFNTFHTGFLGDQVRGFGFLHDGSVDTLFHFHKATVFNQNGVNPTGIPVGAPGDPLRRQLEEFMMTFDSNLAPIVGQQTTRTSSNGATVDPRITLLEQRADAGECDLVAKGRVGGQDRGMLYAGSGQFITDRVTDPLLTDAAVRAFSNTAGQELTFTCVPTGSGLRLGIDHDGDGFGDRDELDAGSDPENAASLPAGGTPICTSTTGFIFRRATMSDHRGALSLAAKDVPLTTYTQQAVATVLTDSGGTIFVGSVPGASIIPKGSSFKFKAPAHSTGIVGVAVKENRHAPGLFGRSVKTKGAWTAGLANETALTTNVTLNVGGQCFHGNATRVRP